MPAITSANLAQAITKLVAADALPALMGNLVMGGLVNRSYEPTLAQVGDSVNVPIPPVMSASNIAEAGSVSTQNPSIGNAQVVLNVHAESSFQIPDITRVIGHPQLLKIYMEPAIIAVAERIETDILKLYTNLNANTAVGTGNTKITEAVVDAAEKALFDAKVPQGIQKNLIVSSQAYSDLRQIERFTEVQTLGSGQAIQTGMVGTIKNFNVFRSQFVQLVSTTTYNMAFARDALALVTKKLPEPLPGTGAIAEFVSLGDFGMRVVMSYAPNTLSQQFTVDVLYGVAVLRNVFGVNVLT